MCLAICSRSILPTAFQKSLRQVAWAVIWSGQIQPEKRHPSKAKNPPKKPSPNPKQTPSHIQDISHKAFEWLLHWCRLFGGPVRPSQKCQWNPIYSFKSHIRDILSSLSLEFYISRGICSLYSYKGKEVLFTFFPSVTKCASNIPGLVPQGFRIFFVLQSDSYKWPCIWVEAMSVSKRTFRRPGYSRA